MGYRAPWRLAFQKPLSGSEKPGLPCHHGVTSPHRLSTTSHTLCWRVWGPEGLPKLSRRPGSSAAWGGERLLHSQPPSPHQELIPCLRHVYGIQFHIQQSFVDHNGKLKTTASSSSLPCTAPHPFTEGHIDSPPLTP